MTEKIGPREVVIRKWVCNGCPALKTEWWKDYLENDETDSGTSAYCGEAKKYIDSYWNPGREAPTWCPAKNND